MSSRRPESIGATSSSTGPSAAVAAPSSARGRGRDVVLARQPEAHESPFGLVRDRRPAELEHHWEPDLGGGEHRTCRVGDRPLHGHGDAVARDERLRLGLGEGRQGASPHMPAPATGAYPTDRASGLSVQPRHDRHRRRLLRPTLVVGRQARGAPVVGGARAHRLRVRTEGRPEAPARLASPLRRHGARGLPVARRRVGSPHRHRHLAGSVDGRDVGTATAPTSSTSSRPSSTSASRTSACSSTTCHPTRRVPRHSGVKPTRRSRPGCTTGSESGVLLSLVPTDYIGTRRSPYLDALAERAARST